MNYSKEHLKIIFLSKLFKKTLTYRGGESSLRVNVYLAINRIYNIIYLVILS